MFVKLSPPGHVIMDAFPLIVHPHHILPLNHSPVVKPVLTRRKWRLAGIEILLPVWRMSLFKSAFVLRPESFMALILGLRKWSRALHAARMRIRRSRRLARRGVDRIVDHPQLLVVLTLLFSLKVLKKVVLLNLTVTDEFLILDEALDLLALLSLR